MAGFTHGPIEAFRTDHLNENPVLLGFLPASPPGQQALAYAINASGHVVGESIATSSSYPFHATLWLDGAAAGLSGGAHDLGVLPGGGWSIARDVSNALRIVGASAVEAMLPEQGELVVIPEADHFFAAGLVELGRAARAFLER